MERIGLESDALHGFIGYSLSLGIGRGVDFGADLQTFFGGGVPDQIDDDRKAFEWLTAPVPGNMAEHAMLNLVPFAGAGWQMTELQGDPCFVGESL